MASRTELKTRLVFRQEALQEARKAYVALLKGQVQRYTIDNRELTKFDLPDLWDTITELEKEVDGLEAALNGSGKRRKAFGVVPRDF